MFREMRRTQRQLGEEETRRILASENCGVLSVMGDDGYPYGVPVNYGFFEGKIYIHGTVQKSHKLDAIRKDSRVCLTVISRHDLLIEEYTTDYESVIVFGRARILETLSEKIEAVRRMMTGIAPDYADQAVEHYRDAMDAVAMIEIVPEHMTGKARS